MKRKIFVFAIAAALSFALAGCNSNMSSSSNSSGAPSVEYTHTQEKGSYGEVYDQGEVDMDFDMGSNSAANPVDGSKRIKTGSLDLLAEDFDNTAEAVKSYTEAVGGYVENYSMYSRQNNNRELRYADYTLRIPAEDYENVKEYISNLGAVQSYNDSVEDVTGIYYDTQTRLDMKLAERDRLLQLLEQAETIEDIILIESRLGEVNGDIEILESALMDMDRRVSYSTLYVYISEDVNTAVQPIGEGIGARMLRAFNGSINFIILLLEGIVVGVAGLIVPGLVIGVVALVGYKIWRRTKKKD